MGGQNLPILFTLVTGLYNSLLPYNSSTTKYDNKLQKVSLPHRRVLMIIRISRLFSCFLFFVTEPLGLNDMTAIFKVGYM